MKSPGFQRRKKKKFPAPAGLRARLLAATLACALFATGVIGLFFLKSVVNESRRVSTDRIGQTIAAAGEMVQVRGGMGRESAKILVAKNTEILRLTISGKGFETPYIIEGEQASTPTAAAKHEALLEIPLGNGVMARADVLLPSSKHLAQLLATETIIAGVAILVLFFLALWPALTMLVVQPLQRLSDLARKLTAGERGERLAETGCHEIKELAGAMNHLGAALSEREHISKANTMAVRYAFRQLRNVVDSLAEGVVVADNQLDTVLVNPTAQKILGITESEVAGSSLSFCFPSSVQRALWPVVADYEESVSFDPATFEVEMKGRSLRFSLAPITDSDDDLSDYGGVVIVIMDVTGDREVEVMKDSFLSSVSHELRTPLTTITSYTEILRDMPPEEAETREEFFGIINEEVGRLTGLVDNLLEISSFEAGKVILHKKEAAIGEIIGATRARFSPQAIESGVQLNFKIPQTKTTPMVNVDQKRIQQVLDILVSNALKFTPRQGLIVVKADFIHLDEGTLDDDTPNNLRITVSDTGPGIPTEDRENIFEKFTQIGDVLKDKPQGTGLGLPIARSIIAAHQGQIWCEQNSGDGARFTLTLPLAEPITQAQKLIIAGDTRTTP